LAFDRHLSNTKRSHAAVASRCSRARLRFNAGQSCLRSGDTERRAPRGTQSNFPAHVAGEFRQFLRGQAVDGGLPFRLAGRVRGMAVGDWDCLAAGHLGGNVAARRAGSPPIWLGPRRIGEPRPAFARELAEA
jgi:hypothetical protein